MNRRILAATMAGLGAAGALVGIGFGPDAQAAGECPPAVCGLDEAAIGVIENNGLIPGPDDVLNKTFADRYAELAWRAVKVYANWAGHFAWDSTCGAEWHDNLCRTPGYIVIDSPGGGETWDTLKDSLPVTATPRLPGVGYDERPMPGVVVFTQR